MLYKGEIAMGTEAEVRLYRKKIQLKMALDCVYFYNGKPHRENVMLSAQSGWLKDFEFLGNDIPPWTDSGEPVPSFSARLYFLDKYGNRVFFNDDERRLMYEHINPVKIWLLNDHLLYMETVTHDLIQLDKRFKSFVNRKDQVVKLGRLEQDERIRTPDIFEYVVKEEENAV